jgi:hypothetical protein
MRLAAEDTGMRALERMIETEILPRLPALADQRAALGGSVWRDSVLLAFAASFAVALVGANDAPEVVPFVMLGAVGLGVWLHALRRARWQGTLIEAVMPAICRCLDDARYRYRGDPDVAMVFEALGLVGAARHRTLVHRIEGRRGSTRFKAQHATLSRTRGRRGAATRLFHGLLFEIAVERPPPSRILIAPAAGFATQVFAGVARPLLPPAYERVATGDAAFDARFRVLVPPGVGAAGTERVQDYLGPAFRAALLDIDVTEGSGPRGPAPSAAFDEDRFLLALPRVDRIGIGALALERARPFLDPGGVVYLPDLETTVRAMAADAAMPYRIVDRLTG